MTSHEELMVWMGSNRPQLLAPDTDIATDIPPGWIHLAKKATGALDKWMPNADEEPIAKLRSIAVREGRLEVAVEQGDEEVRGVIDAIRAMSGEICDRCAGKGDPVEDATGETGSRCRTCRSRGLRVCPGTGRSRPCPTTRHLISPGQWTQDIRGGMTGADWDDSDWRNYGRLETVYAQPMAALMRAEDDVEAMRFWTGTPGWAGLLRALFVTLRPEQDERTDEPGHVPWRVAVDEGEVGVAAHPPDPRDTLSARRGADGRGNERGDVRQVRPTGRSSVGAVGAPRMRRVLGKRIGRGPCMRGTMGAARP